MSQSAQQCSWTTNLGLRFTLRCSARDLPLFEDRELGFPLPSAAHTRIKEALSSVLPSDFSVHDLAARSVLVDRAELQKSELERLIEAQKSLMIAVATGGPRIQDKNDEYCQRRQQIAKMLQEVNRSDPNPSRTSGHGTGAGATGRCPNTRRVANFIGALYQPLLESLAGPSEPAPSDPEREPTGWEKVDRVVLQIINQVATSKNEEEFQTIGLLCRECLISLAEAVYDPASHATSDGVEPSKTDAARMLEAYFGAEYGGASHEALRRHAKASLGLAVQLQHKRGANSRDAALCAEATRTLVNIVAITACR